MRGRGSPGEGASKDVRGEGSLGGEGASKDGRRRGSLKEIRGVYLIGNCILRLFLDDPFHLLYLFFLNL